MSDFNIDFKNAQSVEIATNRMVASYKEAGSDSAEAQSKAEAFINTQKKNWELDEKEVPKSMPIEDFDESLAAKMDAILKEAGITKVDKKYQIFNKFTEELNSSTNIDDEERTKNFIRGVFKMSFDPKAGKEYLASSAHGKTIEHVREKALAPQNETTAADGGYLVPEQLEKPIYSIIENRGLARKLGTVMTTQTDTVLQNKRNAILAASLVAEQAAIPDDKITLTQITHNIKKWGVIPVATNEVLEDNISFLVQELVLQAGEAFAKVEDDQFFASLSGIASAGYTGVFSAPTEIDMDSGDTTFSDLSYAYLLECIGSATDGEARDAIWMMNRLTWYNNVKSLVDTKNNEVGQEGANGKLLLGAPVVTSDSIDGTTAVSTEFIAYGNPKHVFFVDRKRLTMTVLKEGSVDGVSLAETDQTGYRFINRFSIENLFDTAFYAIKTAAS